MSRKEEIKELIIEHNHHLHSLKMQKAKLGIYTPHYILAEIEDGEAEIEKLQVELEVLENEEVNEKVDEMDTSEAPSTEQRTQPVEHRKPGLDKWWNERGYISNPFVWSNAAEVNEKDLSKTFEAWHVDANKPPGSKGLGGTPTLDDVKSQDTGELVLIYAATGSGKTFYRRWAVQQIEEEYGSQGYGLEISDLEVCVQTNHITATELAHCVYKRLSSELLHQEDILQTNNIAYIFEQFDDVIRRFTPKTQETKRVYVFIDGTEHLFREQPTEESHNTQTLKALVDFCKAVAKREGRLLALRLFVPLQVREPLQDYLGARWRKKVHDCTIQWSPEHCRDIIERRLDSSWENGPFSDRSHISYLLADVVLVEFDKWIEQQNGISPRCVIDFLYQLGKYAHRHNVASNDLINVEIWNSFVNSDKSKIPCTPDVTFPLRRPLFRSGLLKWLWLFLILLLSVSLYFGISARAFPEMFFSNGNTFVDNGLIWLATIGIRVKAVIDWLANVLSQIQAYLLLVAVVGGIVFFAWCLIQNTRRDHGQKPSLSRCSQQVWQAIRSRLPGGS